MKDISFYLLVIFSLSFTAYSTQKTPFFPPKAGTTLEYLVKNTKNKTKAHLIQNIEQTYSRDSVLYINYTLQLTDKKNKSSFPLLQLTNKVDHGMTHLHPDYYVAFKNQAYLKFSGEGTLLPDFLRVGQVLENTYSILSQDFQKIRIHMTHRKVMAQEKVHTPTMDYSCYKIHETHTLTENGRQTSYTVYSWYTSEIGIVKIEIYNSEKEKIYTQLLLSSSHKDMSSPTTSE